MSIIYLIFAKIAINCIHFDGFSVEPRIKPKQQQQEEEAEKVTLLLLLLKRVTKWRWWSLLFAEEENKSHFQWVINRSFRCCSHSFVVVVVYAEVDAECMPLATRVFCNFPNGLLLLLEEARVEDEEVLLQFVRYGSEEKSLLLTIILIMRWEDDDLHVLSRLFWFGLIDYNSAHVGLCCTFLRV